MTIKLDASLRRRKPEKRLERLTARPVDRLLSVSTLPIEAVAILADTNVYIAEAAGTLSDEAAAVLSRSLLFHCSVCLAEIAAGIGNADPSHPRWAESRDHYAGLMSGMPPARVLTPDDAIWLDAGILAGTLARTQNYQRHQRKEALNDALILLTAARNGLPVLTSDRTDFDLLQQLAPETTFYWY